MDWDVGLSEADEFLSNLISDFSNCGHASDEVHNPSPPLAPIAGNHLLLGVVLGREDDSSNIRNWFDGL